MLIISCFHIDLWVLLNDQILFYNPPNSNSDKEKLTLSADNARVLRLLHMEEAKQKPEVLHFIPLLKTNSKANLQVANTLYAFTKIIYENLPNFAR